MENKHVIKVLYTHNENGYVVKMDNYIDVAPSNARLKDMLGEELKAEMNRLADSAGPMFGVTIEYTIAPITTEVINA